MGQLTGAVLGPTEVDGGLASAWDGLVAARGTQADVLDSHAFYAAWLAAAPAATVERVRLVVVRDDDRPVAVLPLLARGRGLGVVGLGSRPRARPVVGTPDADPAVLSVLAETVASTGARRLSLYRMPTRDPVTAGFLDALSSSGFHVASRELSSDRLAPAPDGWEAYRHELSGFEKYARRFANRARSQWELTLDLHGTPAGRPVEEGLRIFEALQGRSWKQDFTDRSGTQWSRLLQLTDALRWVRVHVLRIGGVEAAAHVWFRVGDVATWYATAYDQRLAVLGPGTVLQWWAQEQLFAEAEPPLLVDLMPGTTAEKDRLSPERPPLLEVEAVRRRGPWAPPALSAELGVRRAVLRARGRLGAGRRELARRRADRAERRERPDEPVTATGTEVPVAPLDAADVGVRRYLATAAGWSGVEAMAREWHHDDTWWTVGAGPDALLRLRGSERVVEVVRLPGEDRTPAALAAPLAADRGARLQVAGAVAVHDAPLPWPGRSGQASSPS